MKIHPILIAIAGAAVLAACDRPGTKTTEDTAARTAEERDEALVRVIHAIPEAPAADVYTGDQKAFSSVQFGQATAYKPVSQEQFKLTLRAVGKDSPIMIEADQGVGAGGRYTILAMPDRDGAAKLDVVTDEMQAPPPAGKALVRIIHAAPEVGSVDVYSSAKKDDPEIDNVDYGGPARYQEVDPHQVKVSIESKGDADGPKSKAAAVVSDAPLEAGKVYTLVIAPPDEPGKAARMIQIEDPVQPPTAAARVPDIAKQPAAQPATEPAPGGADVNEP